MSDLPDFDLDSEWLDPAAETPSPASSVDDAAPVVEEKRPAEPVVVIQYRNRGISPILLFPMTLIASLALFAGYHHFFVQPIFTREGGFALARAAEAAEPETPARDPAVAQASVMQPIQVAPAIQPLSLESQPLGPIASLPLPPPVTLDLDSSNKPPVTPPSGPVVQTIEQATTQPEAPPVAVEETKPEPRISIASAVPDPVKEDSPAPTAEALPEPPTPTREEMMERIRQESELKELHQQDQARRQAEAGAQIEAENAQRVENERALFHKSLQDLVAAGGQDVGKAIDDLCDQFGRVYNQDKKNQVKAVMERAHGKLSRNEEVALLRSLGVPEPGVLDYLANEIHRRSLHARNGPQNSDEVRLFAARALLRIGPDSPEARSTSAAPERGPRPIATRRRGTPNGSR